MLVHYTWSVFLQCGLTRQIQRRPSTKGQDLHLGQTAESTWHQGTDILIINVFYWKTCNQKGKWKKTICTYWGMRKSLWPIHGLTLKSSKKRPVLWPFRHALYICFNIDMGNAFENQNGVIMIKLHDRCGCDFRHIHSCIVANLEFSELCQTQGCHKDLKIPPPSSMRFWLKI